MEDFSEVFNGLSDEQKLANFIELHNLMARNNRFGGWVVYFKTHFLFFDSKPSYDFAIFVIIDELLEWIEELSIATNQPMRFLTN